MNIILKRRSRTRVGAGILLAVVMLLMGCAAAHSPEDRLNLRVDSFNDQVRWMRFFSAAEFVHEDEREDWLTAHRDWGDDLRIADYEVVDSRMQEDGTALVRVVISWYRLSQSELQTTMLAQRWRRESRSWHLVSEEVEEGDPLS